MEKAKVEKWLNRMVKVTKQFIGVKDLPGMSRCSQLRHMVNGKGVDVPYVHMYKGLHTIAEIMGFEVVVDYEDDDNTCYMFTYDGVDFIQLDHKDEEKI